MVAVCMYFQVHQPFRIRRDFDFFSIARDSEYEDATTNAAIMRRVAEKCYLPTNRVLAELIAAHGKRFKVAFSISGTALDQFELYAPEVLASFQELAATGQVEFLAETYYHSLAALFSPIEFRRQVKQHRTRVRELFGQTPKTFRNTELIYSDAIAAEVAGLGFRTVLAEGADRILGWRSPNFVYRAASAPELTLLLKNYRLSDDIAFRFSDRNWSEWPLTAERYARWLHQVAGGGDVIGLFMDYETFGEHQWASTGIFDFLRALPGAVLAHPDFTFATPNEVRKQLPAVADLSFPEPVSWADVERDTSAWLGNRLQDASIERVYAMEKSILATRDERLIHAWRKLQTSDHFYYMCIKWFADGDVHKYFNPYDSPYDAFIHYTNALNQLGLVSAEVGPARRRQRQAGRPSL